MNDPIQRYKNHLEYACRAQWAKPENLKDDHYAVEALVEVERDGRVRPVSFPQVSGNGRWDQSVRDVFTHLPRMDEHPPADFPPRVRIRFDVADEAEPMVVQ